MVGGAFDFAAYQTFGSLLVLMHNREMIKDSFYGIPVQSNCGSGSTYVESTSDVEMLSCDFLLMW